MATVREGILLVSAVAYSRLRGICVAISVAILCAGFVGNPVTAQEEGELDPSFDTWLVSFVAEAAREGVSQQTLRTAFENVRPLRKILVYDHRQLKHALPLERYIASVVNEARVRKGRGILESRATLLDAVEKQFGVQPQFLVALWGIETDFGTNCGRFYVPQALATLAYDARRATLFRRHLLAALKILDDGHIAREKMLGSWAGAMGQFQFMPLTFQEYAVDGDGDGRRDIWTSEPDALFSAGNYLAANGWRTGEPWGAKVQLPPGFDFSLATLKTRKPVSEWSTLGIQLANGRALQAANSTTASIVAPEGKKGPAFVVYANFHVIMRWNRSTRYAIAVGLLADRLAAPS